MEYEWDVRKAASNLFRHGVDFADAVGLFEDAMAITIEQPESTEDRYLTVGADVLGRVLVVAYTWRGDRIRLIPARKAARPERRQYEGKR